MSGNASEAEREDDSASPVATKLAATEGRPRTAFDASKVRHNQFYGNLVLQARNWRYTAWAAIAVAFVAVWWVGHIGSQSKFVPYIVEVDSLGNAAYSGPADKVGPHDPRMLKAFLSMFVTDLRSVTADSVVEKSYVDHVYAMVGSGTAAQVRINQFFTENNPYQRGATSGVSVDVESLLPLSEHTWQVTWKETERTHAGQVIGVKQWKASVTFSFNPPTDERLIWMNPLGLYVTDINWAEVL